MRGGCALLAVSSLLAAGCRQDMHDQPRYDAARGRARSSPTAARARGRSSRARSRAARCRTTTAFFTGKVDGAARDANFPFADRRRRCSSAARSASTSTARRATAAPATATAWSCSAATGSRRRYHIDRLRAGADAGYFFDVMTNGFGAMPDYPAQIAAADRWASSPTCARCSSASTRAAADCRRRAEQPTQRQPPAAGGRRHDAGGEKHCSDGRHTAVDRRDAAGASPRAGQPARALIVGRGRPRAPAPSAPFVEPDAVLPVLPDRLPASARLALGSLGAADAAAPDGRQLGPGRPARARGGRRTLPLAGAAASSRSLFGLPTLYEWAHPEAVANDAILQHKAPYLNVPFFLGRAVALLRRLDAAGAAC